MLTVIARDLSMQPSRVLDVVIAIGAPGALLLCCLYYHSCLLLIGADTTVVVLTTWRNASGRIVSADMTVGVLLGKVHDVLTRTVRSHWCIPHDKWPMPVVELYNSASRNCACVQTQTGTTCARVHTCRWYFLLFFVCVGCRALPVSHDILPPVELGCFENQEWSYLCGEKERGRAATPLRRAKTPIHGNAEGPPDSRSS